MICSFGPILAWKSDDDADAAAAADADDDHKSDPYMSPSYAGDTKTVSAREVMVKSLTTQSTLLQGYTQTKSIVSTVSVDTMIKYSHYKYCSNTQDTVII